MSSFSKLHRGLFHPHFDVVYYAAGTEFSFDVIIVRKPHWRMVRSV